MNAPLFMLIVTFFTPSGNGMYTLEKIVTPNLIEEQCIVQQAAVVKKAQAEHKNILAMCKQQ